MLGHSPKASWLYLAGRCAPWGESGMNGIKQRLELLENAAEKGHVEAAYVLGCDYLYDAVSPDRFDKGIIWLQKAADQNHKSANEVLENIERDYIDNDYDETERVALNASLEKFLGKQKRTDEDADLPASKKAKH